MISRCHALAFILLVHACAAQCPRNPSIHNFKFGTIRGKVLSDGFQVVDSSPFLVPQQDVVRSYRACFRRINPIIFAHNVVLLDTPAGRVLIDTGSFNQPLDVFPFLRNAGRLRDNFDAAGVSPESIDAVVLTHGHLDHVGGLITANGTAFFPNAVLYVSETEHAFWTMDPVAPAGILPPEVVTLFANIYRRSVLPYADRLVLVPDGGRPLEGFRFILGPGHSPGHSAIEVTSGRRRLILAGDSWITKTDQLQHPEWGHTVESNTTEAMVSRRRLLQLAANRKDLVIAYHEDFPGLGHVVRSGDGFDWIPFRAQLLGIGVAPSC